MTLSRRQIITAALGAASMPLLAPASALARAPDAAAMNETSIEDRYKPQIVRVRPGLLPGDVHVDSTYHFLYLILPDNQAIRYGVAVGSEGRAFKGVAVVGRKAKWPTWTPTPEMIKRDPGFYGPFRNGMPGGKDNPLGARAIYLYQDGKDTLYRIHGTPQPWTIGRSVSSGCIRMVNEHVTDLYERVAVGATVIVH